MDKLKEQSKPKTVKARIDEIVDKVEDKIELKKQLFLLVQKILYPNQFCPECEERMFFNPNGFSCPNCGYVSQPLKQVVELPQGTKVTPVIRPQGVIPPVVEQTIKEAEEGLKEKPLPRPKSTALGDKIRKLKDQMDSGGPNPENERIAESRLRNTDPNVGGKVNWL